MVAKSRIGALVGAAVLVVASVLVTSPPVAARALYTRRCYPSYHHRPGWNNKY